MQIYCHLLSSHLYLCISFIPTSNLLTLLIQNPDVSFSNPTDHMCMGWPSLLRLVPGLITSLISGPANSFCSMKEGYEREREGKIYSS